MTFGQRFKAAKKSGVATFTWTKAQGGDGKRYTTKTKDEVSKKGTKASVSKLKKKKRGQETNEGRRGQAPAKKLI